MMKLLRTFISSALLSAFTLSAMAVESGSSGSSQAFSVKQPTLDMNYIIAVSGVFPTSGGSGSYGEDVPMLGEISAFAGNFIPSGWMLCDGTELNISSNTALYSIIGTIYGGDGSTTFALPNLRGRVPVGAGTGYTLGSVIGADTATLAQNQMPAHIHSTAAGNTGSTGGSTAVSIRQPGLVLNYIINTVGDFSYMSEVRLFAGNFAPGGWALCQGQSVSIASNTALFSLLGTTYGGNGTTNFNLPNLVGRTVMGSGAGSGLTSRTHGQALGSETVVLSGSNLPGHVHTTAGDPTGSTGSGTGFSIMQPALVMTAGIKVYGIYPSSSGGSASGDIMAQVRCFAYSQSMLDIRLNGDILPMNGLSVSVSSNTALFTLLGTTYGGNGTTNYNLPDLQGRLLQGANPTRGVKSGTETRVLSGTNLPAHTHTLPVAAPTVTSSIADLANNEPTLTIIGTGFDTTPGNNTVVFNNGAVGTVTAATSTELTVTFSTLPTSLGSLTVVVTTNSVSSGAAVQVATVIAASAPRALYFVDSDNTKDDILKVSPSGSGNTPEVVVNALGGTFTNKLEIDNVNERLFWWEGESDKIYRANLDGTGTTVLVTLTSAANITDLAYDPVADELYFIDSDPAVESILKVDASGTNETPTTVVGAANIGGQFANDLTIDITGRRLFWFENDTDTIYRSDIDGSNRVVFLTLTSDAVIQDLEYEPVNNEIYYIDSDAAKEDIMKVSAAGTNNTPVVAVDDLGGQFANCMAVDATAGEIFWWENETDIIYRSNLSGGSRVSLVTLTSAALIQDIELFIPGALPPSAPEIAVFDGAGTGGAERTDNSGTVTFGSVNTGSSSSAQTFTIKNSGTSDLTGITVTSTNGTEFTVGGTPSATLAPNATTSFTVTFSPSAGGARSGTINIASNDANENPFEILVSGTGVVPAPEIAVTGKTLNIADGDVTPRPEDDTDFGETTVGSPITRSFTVTNNGTATLNLGAITVLPAGFTIVAPLATSTVAPTESTVVNVKCDALTASVFTSTLSIVNDDADENPFNFSITCEVVEPPIAPIVTTLGDVVTGGEAPAEDGTAPIGDFGVLRRGGFIAENGYMAFPGTLEIGTGIPEVTLETSSGIWKTAGGNLFLLARSGTTVPDVAGAQFDVLPEVPGINDSGEVGFLGTLIIGTGGVTVNDDTGLWSDIGGSGLKLLMREDDDVPGLAGVKVKQFASGLFAMAHTGATTGEAAYSVTYKGASTKTALLRASVSGATTTISVVAQEGEAAPGTSVNFANLAGSYTDPGRMDALGNFVFSALTTPGSKDGIWYQAVGGATELAVFRGDVAPGTSGATFSKIYRPSMGSAGVFAFRAAVANNTGDNTGNTRNDGIWRGSVAGGFNCILRRGDDTSVVSNLPGVSLVGNVWGGWLSNNNLGAWKAWLDVNGNTVSSNADGDVHAIYTDLSGTMQLALQAGDAAPGTTGASFSGFDLPVVGGTDQYAFLGTLTGGDTTAANNEGLWRSASNGGVLSLVVRKGDVITTTEGDKTIIKIDLPGSNSTDRRWEQPVMDGTGQMVIYITFGDGSTTQILAK